MFKIDAKPALISSLCFTAFSFFLKQGGVSLFFVVNLYNDMFRKALTSTGSTYQSLGFLLSSYAGVFIAFLFFAAGLAFISVYSSRKSDIENPLVPAAAGSLMAFIFFGVSLMSAFVAAAIVSATLIAAKQSNIYFGELKKWKFFRTGSKSIGNALFVFNLVISVGALVALSSSADSYRAAFISDVESAVSEVALKDISNPELKDAAESKIKESIENSALINSYLRWLPVITAVSLWIVLEVTRIFLSNIGGAVTHLVFSMEEK